MLSDECNAGHTCCCAGAVNCWEEFGAELRKVVRANLKVEFLLLRF